MPRPGPGAQAVPSRKRLDGGRPARRQSRNREGIIMTDIAVQPLEVGTRSWTTVRLNSARLAVIAFAIAALIAAAFAVGRITGPSHTSTVRQSVPAAVVPGPQGAVQQAGNAPGLGDVKLQQPALVCHLHGPC